MIGLDERITSEAQLAAICRRTLANWPEARAAVLFGSRARGDHRPDSDWDVAVIIDGKSQILPVSRERFPQAESILAFRDVDAWAVSEQDMRTRLGELGALPGCIARDGHMLHGHWIMPSLEGVVMKLKPEKFQRRMKNTLGNIRFSINQFSDISTEEFWQECLTSCGYFLQFTSNAAELLAKCLMERRGIHADRTHDILSLVLSFKKASPDHTELAERMRALNGLSRVDHTAMYGEEVLDAEVGRNAVRRLLACLDLWISELEADPDDGAMKETIPNLVRRASKEVTVWKECIDAPFQPKPGDGSEAMRCAKAILDAREEIRSAIGDFSRRLEKLELPEN